MKPLLVGEANPYQTSARAAMHFALYPEPAGASGDRLCRFVMGLDADTYLAAYDRTDLCWPKWNMREARFRATALMAERRPADVIVLCGRKVATAFGLDAAPFSVWHDSYELTAPTLVVLPHPSGLCRLWHEPGAVARARALLREVGVLPSPVTKEAAFCGSL